MEAVRLRIADKYFFDNAELLLPSIKDAAGGLLEDGVNAWLTQIYNLTPKTHKDRGVARSGYDAKELNGALREKMNVISGIHKETCVDCGALLSKGKEGFDFSLFDEEYNIVKLRNAFVGNQGRYDGEEILKTINKRVFKPSGDTYSKCEWREEIASLGGTLGKNISHQKNRYTIVGEIQFGNWALAEHDLLRLMGSAVDGEIDYYIYITATGELEKKLSKGIVTFSKAVDLFKNNKRLFRTPVWVIGIDIDNS